MCLHSRHLRTAGKASVQNTSRSPNPSPSKTRGNAIVHSVSTGFKFDINVVSSQSRIKADVQSRKGKPSPPSAFLAPTAQKMGEFENSPGKDKASAMKPQKANTADGSEKSAKSPISGK